MPAGPRGGEHHLVELLEQVLAVNGPDQGEVQPSRWHGEPRGGKEIAAPGGTLTSRGQDDAEAGRIVEEDARAAPPVGRLWRVTGGQAGRADASHDVVECVAVGETHDKVLQPGGAFRLWRDAPPLPDVEGHVVVVP